MLLRSCGWSGRVQEAGRMAGRRHTHVRKTRPDKVPAPFQIQNIPSRPARAQQQWERRCVWTSTPTGAAAGKARGRGIPRQRALLRPVVGVACQRLRRRIHSELCVLARRPWLRDGYSKLGWLHSGCIRPIRVSVTQRNPDSRNSFRLAPARERGSEATFTKNPHVGRRRGLLYLGKDPQGQC